jgi:small-conductance mechanosensitive channel
MNTFNFNFKLDKEGLLKASKAVYDYEYKNSFRRYIGWFFIALLQFGVVALMKKGEPLLFLLSSIVVIYWYFLRWSIRKFFYLKVIDKTDLVKHHIAITINDSGVYINGSALEWDKITKVMVSSDIGVLLFIGKEFILIPKSAIDNKKDLIDFIKSKGVKVIDLDSLNK